MTSIERTGDRIRATKRMQRQRGRYLGGIVPWGWIKGADGELVPIQNSRLPSRGCGRCGRKA